MPAHFTHIYAAHRVADHLAAGPVASWTGPGPSGDPEHPTQPTFDANKIGSYAPDYCASVLGKWGKFAATGAIGPDLLYASQDYAAKLPAPLNIIPPSDEIMLALAVYFYYRTNIEDDYEPLLIILDKVDSTMGAIVRLLIKLEKLWSAFLKTWTSTIGPLVNAADSALDDLTGGLISEFEVGIAELKTGLITLVEEELLSVQDIFASFDTCVAKGWDDQSFIWGDTLHYRRTSRMARALVEQAEHLRTGAPADEDRFEQAMAFAMGWISHVGMDTIGHAFVNEQCGGPFRNHPQRHHLIENHIDAWNYRKTGAGGTLPAAPFGATPLYPDISLAGLGFAVQMTEDDPHGDDRPATLPDDPKAAKAALSTDGELPGWLADGIVSAMIATYGGEPTKPFARHTHPEVYGGSDFQATIDENVLTKAIEDVTGHGPDKPLPLLLADIAPTPGFTVPHGFPLPWQIQTCYRLVMTLYNLTYTGSWDLDKPRKPPFVITPPASDLENLLSPPDFTGASSGDPLEDVCNAVKALVDWITKELDAALKLAGDLVKMLASPGSYLLRLGLYELAMLVWDATQKVHEMLAHMGFFMPHGETRYPDHELRLGNEIDESLISLGGTVDAAFQEALADALDPFANLDHSRAPIVGHPIPDGAYPYYMVAEYDDVAATTPSRDAGKLVTAEYRRPWAYPAFAYHGRHTLIPNRSELSAGSVSAPVPPQQTAPIPGPYPSGDTPDVAFFRPGDPNPAALQAYEASRRPQDTDDLNRTYLTFDRAAASPLGDAIPFGCYLIGRILNDRSYATHFNLDADRAYGYLTWDWLRDGQLVDADLPGVKYVPPVTPPQMSPDPLGAAGKPPAWRDPTHPLLLEYIDRPPTRMQPPGDG